MIRKRQDKNQQETYSSSDSDLSSERERIPQNYHSRSPNCDEYSSLSDDDDGEKDHYSTPPRDTHSESPKSKKLKTFHHGSTTSCSSDSNTVFYEEVYPSKNSHPFQSSQDEDKKEEKTLVPDRVETSPFYIEWISLSSNKNSYQSKISYFANFTLKNEVCENMYTIVVDGRRAHKNEKQQQIKYVFYFGSLLVVVNEELEIFAAKMPSSEIVIKPPPAMSRPMTKAEIYLCNDELNYSQHSNLSCLNEIVQIRNTSGGVYVVTKRKVFHASVHRQCPYKMDETTFRLSFTACVCDIDEDDYFINAEASSIDHLIFLTKNNFIYSTGMLIYCWKSY